MNKRSFDSPNIGVLTANEALHTATATNLSLLIFAFFFGKAAWAKHGQHGLSQKWTEQHKRRCGNSWIFVYKVCLRPHSEETGHFVYFSIHTQHTREAVSANNSERRRDRASSETGAMRAYFVYLFHWICLHWLNRLLLNLNGTCVWSLCAVNGMNWWSDWPNSMGEFHSKIDVGKLREGRQQ